MLEGFAEFAGQIFPAVDPKTAQKLIAKIRTLKPDGSWLYGFTKDAPPLQGDILEDVDFSLFDSSGVLVRSKELGLFLSNTCDGDQSGEFEHVLIAAVLPLDGFPTSMHQPLRANEFTSLFFLPGVPNRGDMVLDLGLVQSYSAEAFRASVLNGSRKQISRLSDCGYLMLLTKLTAHLLRPETDSVSRLKVTS